MRKHFLRVFLPTILIGLAVTSFIYRAHYTGVKEQILEESILETKNIAHEIGDQSAQIARSLTRISSQVTMDDDFDPMLLERSLRGLIESRQEVLQVRFMDTTGQEQIRFNRRNGQVQKLTAEELQDKSNRFYYKDNQDLEPGQITFTPITLNYEQGVPEKPYTLVSRWITPVFTSNGDRLGILVVNLNINNILKNLERVATRVENKVLLRSYDSAVYYGGIVYLKQSLDSLNQAIGLTDVNWNVSQQTSGGLIANSGYLNYSDFVQVYAENLNLNIDEREGSSCMLVSFVPRKEYVDLVHVNMPYIIFLQSFLTLMIGFFSYRWARFRLTETIAFSELYKSNRKLKDSEEKLEKAMKLLEKRVVSQETEIEEAQRLLSILFDSSNHFAGIMDPSGQLVNVNQKTLNLLGAKKHQVVGKYIWDFPFFGDQKEVEKTMAQAIEAVKGGDVVSFTAIMFDAEGKKHRVAFTLSPLLNEEGVLTHLIPEGVDITELYEKDKQLRGLIEQLETRNTQLREFSHIISHNVRSPIGNLGLLLSMYEDVDTAEERNEIIEKLKQVNSSLLHLLEELLETIKVLDNDQVMSENLSIKNAIDQSKDLLSRQLEEANASVKVDIKVAPSVFFPKLYLNSLLLNLMSNAVKYRSEERDLVIEITMERDEKDRPVMLFSDNGSGIDMKRHGSKVFKLYKTFHRNKPGKGLGLFMTKTQVESVGGRMNLTSKINEGTTFKVTFPLPPVD